MKTLRLLLVVLTAGTLLAQDRLDSNQMRDSLFSALSGHPEAFKKILDTSSKALSLNPDHAQAMVWHGVATFGGFFVEAQKGNMPTAMASLEKGTAEMDRAVSLAPDDIEVRIMRAVMYSPASRQLPPPLATDALEKARSDFQHAFDLQKSKLDQMGTHPLGELLQNLADLNSRQGKTADAERYYAMIQTKLKDTEYARRAGEWMKTKKPLPEAQTNCVGCHVAQ